MASSAYAIDDSRPLADVLAVATSQAGLSVDDEPVGRAQRALAQEMFVNAYTMRFKRQRTGDWDWLQKDPFRIPMCLADLIGHCLDQKLDAPDRDAGDVEAAAAAAASTTTSLLPSKAALKFLLGDGCHQDAPASSDPALFSPGSESTPTLAAIRMDGSGGEGVIDFVRNLLLDDEGDAVLDKPSRSESPRARRSLTKSRHHSSKRSRSSRSGKPTARQPRPAAAELSPAPPPSSEKAVSPLKVAKPAVRDGSTSGRAPRRSARESSLVRAMTSMLKYMSEPLPFDIELVRAIPVLPDDDQSSYESYSSDNSGSDIDDEGRRLSARRTTPSKVDESPNGRDCHQSSSSWKRREADRSRFEQQQQQNGNGTSPKRKRLNYSSDR